MEVGIRVTVEPVTILVSPFLMHHYAADFLAAARAAPETQAYSPVRYYLVCHAIEVVLKGFCRARGDDLDALRRELRHDLTLALARARGHGLDSLVPVSADEEQELAKANEF